MPSLLDPSLEKALQKDAQYFATTRVPIVTVSASFKEDIKGFYGHLENEDLPDVVFSRAHYSMALAIAIEAWGNRVDPTKAWVIDPTNYVAHGDWRGILLTEAIGKTIARHPLLKLLKDFIDRFGRGKLPIQDSITPPLLFVTKDVTRPILSLHIAAGNILVEQGKKVVQVITDPHVRDEYLKHVDNPNLQLCVFDEKTKTDVLEKAALLGKVADPTRITVTGAPIDPRVLAAATKKTVWRNGPLRLCITTGGLGTNKFEIHQLLNQLLPLLRREPLQFQIMVYAATQKDIYDMVRQQARAHHVKVRSITDTDKPRLKPEDKLIVIYHPQIVDANEMLLKFGFPWAHGFITKPSGDMAYDAAASGSFLLTLQEWGVWEHNISEFFEQRGIARKAKVDDIVTQLDALTTASGPQSWVERAMHNTRQLESALLHGSNHILAVMRRQAH